MSPRLCAHHCLSTARTPLLPGTVPPRSVQSHIPTRRSRQQLRGCETGGIVEPSWTRGGCRAGKPRPSSVHPPPTDSPRPSSLRCSCARAGVGRGGEEPGTWRRGSRFQPAGSEQCIKRARIAADGLGSPWQRRGTGGCS